MRPPEGLTEIHDDRDDAVRDVSRALSGWFPGSTHPGGFAWEAATGQLPERIAVVRDAAGALVGWGGFSPDDARVECAPGDDATTDLLATWILDAAGDGPASVAVHRGQDRLRGILAGRGFVDEAVPLAGLRHPARDTSARPPAGYLIRPRSTPTAARGSRSSCPSPTDPATASTPRPRAASTRPATRPCRPPPCTGATSTS
jgi:hypothetical protein